MDDEPLAETSKPAGLHSPPDSNKAMDADGSDSELSDLEDVASRLEDALRDDPIDEPKAEPKEEESQPAPEPEPEPEPEPVVEDIGEVLPDHWSGTVPVFKPDMKQFQDFKRFMEKVDKYGMKSGIIKIIAPQEWRESLPPVDDLVKQIRVREPIKQDIMGSNGTYRQVNILHQRSYNLPQWRQLCDQSEHQPPARRGERRANSDRKPAVRSRAAAEPKTRAAGASAPAKKRKGGRVTRRSTRAAKEETEEPEDRPMTPVSPAPEKTDVLDSVEKEAGVKEEEEPCDDEDEPPVVRRMGGFSRQLKPKTQSTSARRKYIRREGSAMIDEAAFKNWDYHMDISEYTPERCEELEKTYWKTLTYAPPLYGADLPGTLFDESVKMWNLDRLPNLLDVLGTKVPGVNTAYLYLGMWKATFAWHLEDVDLYSINYLHFGAPKQWYSISQADARRFEAAMKNIWPTEAKACDQFLRHKAFLISPSTLKQQYNITVNKCVSYPGEFVVTYPYGYHSGYNLGYNCAEAVNFALDSWLPMGKIAKKCQCAQAQDSVWVDVYEIERKLRGEETEYEETDDDEEEDEDDEDQDTGLPSPPSSHTLRAKGPGRKRKRAAGDKEPRAKTKKIRLRLKSHVEPPCCLCPSDIPGAEIMPTDDGRKAHRMCALYLPETYIETVDGQEIIANAAAIDKARLDLKCLYCRSKKGACFQCSQKKCPRSYHATCAAAAGVFVEEEEVPVFGEDGTEYKEQAFSSAAAFIAPREIGSSTETPWRTMPRSARRPRLSRRTISASCSTIVARYLPASWWRTAPTRRPFFLTSFQTVIGLKSNGSGCCCPTRQTFVFPRRRRMPSRCRHAGKRRRRSTPNGPWMNPRAKTTSLAPALCGPNSMQETRARTLSRPGSTSPRTTKSGTTSARHRQRPRRNTPRTLQDPGTTPRATSWIPYRSRRRRYGCPHSFSRGRRCPARIPCTRPSPAVCQEPRP